jgi:hypothetical protein
MRSEAVPLLENDYPPPGLPAGWASAPQRVKRVATTGDLMRELNAVYRDMRVGRLPTADGSRMANCLDIMRRTIEAGDHERRIRELENTLLARQEPEA